MAALSDYLENELLDHLLGGGDYSAPATLYLALFTAAPTDAGGGTEATGGSYARLAITNNLTNLPAAAIDGSVTEKANGVTLTMFTASGSVSGGSNMTHWGIYDASSGGNLLVWGALDTPAAVGTGDTPTFDVGALVISMGGNFGNTVRAGLLDLAFGGQTYTRPSTVYGGLFTAPPGQAGGGTEVTGGTYSRISITNNATNFPSASAGAKSLGVTHAYPTATASWGAVTDFALFDSASGGNILFFKTLTTTRSVASGQTFRIAAGDLDVSLD
jgi:hypothetical protein